MADSPSPKKDVVLTTAEKIAGGIILGGIGLGLAYGLTFVLPMLIALEWNMLQLGIGAAVIGGLAYMALDKDVHFLFSRGYRLMIRKIRRNIFTWDPIGNLELNIQHMEKREREMGANRQALQTQITGLERRIETMKGEMEDALGQMQNAQQNGQRVNVNPNASTAEDDEENQATRAANAYGRREASVERLTKMLTTLQSTAKTLKRIHNGVKFLIEDTKDEVMVARTELLASTAAGDAADNAMQIINGDPQLKQAYREAMQIIDDKVADRLGAVEMAVNDSKGFLSTVDGKNSKYNKSALKALQAWDKNTEKLRLNPDAPPKQRVADGEPLEADEERVQAAAQQMSATSDTDRLFDSDK